MRAIVCSLAVHEWPNRGEAEPQHWHAAACRLAWYRLQQDFVSLMGGTLGLAHDKRDKTDPGSAFFSETQRSGNGGYMDGSSQNLGDYISGAGSSVSTAASCPRA